MSNGVITITDDEFETEVLLAEIPVLVYFWATWCGPCHLMTPLISSTATIYSDRLKVVKMEIDPNPTTVKKYEVTGVPALRLIRKKEVLGSVEGALGKDKLLSFIDSYLN